MHLNQHQSLYATNVNSPSIDRWNPVKECCVKKGSGYPQILHRLCNDGTYQAKIFYSICHGYNFNNIFLLSTYSNLKRLSSLLMTFIFFTFDILTHAFHSFIHPYPTHIISVYGLLFKKTNDETFLIGILYIEYHHMTN